MTKPKPQRKNKITWNVFIVRVKRWHTIIIYYYQTDTYLFILELGMMEKNHILVKMIITLS